MNLPLLLLLPALLCGQSAPEKAALEGQVVNTATGEGIRKAAVSLRGYPVTGQSGPPPSYSVMSDALGRFAFAGVTPGSYQLSVQREGFALSEIKVDGGRLAQLVTLAAGDRKMGFLANLTPFGAISGRIWDADGDPLRQMQVAVVAYQYTPTGRQLVERSSAGTDDRGQYRIYDLPAGRYFIRAGESRGGLRLDVAGESRGGLRLDVAGQQPGTMSGGDSQEVFTPTFYPDVSDAAAPQLVDLEPGQQLRGFDIRMRKTRLATIRGRVVAPQGAANVMVGLFTTVPGGGSSSTTMNVRDPRDGSFELHGIAPGTAFLTGSYPLNRSRFTAQAQIPVAGEDINGAEIHPLPLGEITVHVEVSAAPDAKPPAFQIALSGQGSSNNNRVPIDDNTFTIPDIEPGIYDVLTAVLTAVQPPYYMKEIHWGGTDIIDNPLDLTAGVPPSSSLTVTLGADGGEIAGTVNFAARVVLVPTGGHRTRSFYKNVGTSASGQYKFTGIAPGTYKLYAWDRVDVNAVIYDPGYMKPYESLGREVRFGAGGKLTQDLKMIVSEAP